MDAIFCKRKKIVQVCPGLRLFVHEFIFGVVHVSLAASVSVVSWILEYSFFLLELFISNGIIPSKFTI